MHKIAEMLNSPLDRQAIDAPTLAGVRAKLLALAEDDHEAAQGIVDELARVVVFAAAKGEPVDQATAADIVGLIEIVRHAPGS
ncbi:hypothetical protein ABT332_13490 [Saccharomonospora azurea]|uniref:hypothetical protein n=1 Tax=Saccharomonospora azurea TaxID=40988 RepID=UPI0033174278